MISFPAPALCQGGDEQLLVTMGDIIFPGFVTQSRNENGLQLGVEGDPSDSASVRAATAQFQTLLGALRAWRADAGELQEERLAGLGQGSVRDEAGNQWVKLGTVIAYATTSGEVERFAVDARTAMEASQELQNSLWLNGRANRTAADYYMIHEYARIEFGDKRKVCERSSGSPSMLKTASQHRPTTCHRSKVVVMQSRRGRRYGILSVSGSSPPTS